MTWKKITVPILALIVFGLFWEFLVWVNGWPNYKMASPSDLWPAFWKFRWLFLEYSWDTLWRTVVGLMVAVVFGVFIGMIMGFSRTMRDALYPLLVGFNAIPKATVVPIIAPTHSLGYVASACAFISAKGWSSIRSISRSRTRR